MTPQNQEPKKSESHPMPPDAGRFGSAAISPSSGISPAVTNLGGPGLITTTLQYPIGVNDITMVITPPIAQSVVIGMKALIDNEIFLVAQAYLATRYAGTNTIPILRGQSGTVTVPHAAGAQVLLGDAYVDFSLRTAAGLASNFPGVTPWSASLSLGTGDTVIPVPQSIGFSTVVLSTGAKTLALPGPDLNGAILMLTAPSGTATVTIPAAPTGAPPGATSVSVTNAGPVMLMAQNGVWQVFPVA